MMRRVFLVVGVEAAVFIALLFGLAGTFRWPEAWIMLGTFFIPSIWMIQMIAKRDPALLAERMKPFIQKGQPLWDQILMSSVAVVYVAWLALMPLDAVRFHWSSIPIGLQVAGAIGNLAGMILSYYVLRENTFLIPVVRLQPERSQHVISTGPYAVVRHPLYSAALLIFISTPLLLGSVYGLLGTLLLTVMLAIRTVNEEAVLRRGLEGYPEYASRVRYRFIPGVW